MEHVDKIIKLSYSLGVSSVALISVRDIKMEKRFSEICLKEKCINYGLSRSCPPYSMKFENFRKLLKKFKKGIFIQFIVPENILHSPDNIKYFKNLHITVSKIESYTKELGYKNVKGFAGGSCKKIFCSDYPDCNFIKNGRCRFPELAKESMSGVGINVKYISDKYNFKNYDLSIFGLILI